MSYDDKLCGAGVVRCEVAGCSDEWCEAVSCGIEGCGVVLESGLNLKHRARGGRDMVRKQGRAALKC
jgi:hypothetical protein